MASITSVSNSNYVSSLYNSSNIISGLASGMDTESMIENLTKAYQTKITQLQQKSTKIGWKQDAYRSIISKMYSFSNKYTSYTSSTNLLSPSFFSSARTSVAQGGNASKVSASGTSTSEVELNSVQQLAAAARYATKSNLNAGDGQNIVASGAIDLEGTTPVSTIQGSLNLTYGTKTVSLYFRDNEIIEPRDGETNAEALARVIQDKLKDEEIVLNSGSVSAAERIAVSVDEKTGEISFKEKGNAGNNVYISSASDSVKDWLQLPDLDNASEDKPASFTIPNATNTDAATAKKYFQKEVDNIDAISGKTFNINLDGTTKQVKGPLITKDKNGDYLVGGTTDANGNRKDYTRVAAVKADATDADKAAAKKQLNDAYVSELNKSLKKEFGDKIKVENVAPEKGATYDDPDNGLQLKFTVPKDSDILINTDAGDALKIGKTASNYLNTSKTLGSLMDEGTFANLTPSEDSTDGNPKYDFVINGTKVGSYDKDTTLATIMSDINASDAGVKVTYSKTSREFVFTTKDTGEHTEIDMGPGLASAMFGQKVSVNSSDKTMDLVGESIRNKTFSVNVDGKEVSFKFNSDSGNVGQMLNKLNGSLQSTLGSDYKASFADDGSLVIKDQNGKAVQYSFGDNDEVGQKLVDNLRSLKPTDTDDMANANYSYSKGQDAKFTVTVNGTTKQMSRASNKVEIDGLTINFKGTFNEEVGEQIEALGDDNRTQNAMKNIIKQSGAESVTFQEDIQADQVVDAVKNMIAEYNVMVAEIRSAYSTMPAQSSNGSIQEYEPLTDEDRATMSESAIQNYEEKAKQGLLFADSNLSNLYQGLVSIFNRTGKDSATLSNMGIGISYDTNGAATITFQEDKFRKALEDDFDGVVDIFTRSSSDGGTDGIMQSMKAQLDRYGSTTGAVKGILVQQAGTPLASLSLLDNGWQKEIDTISTEIERVQEKLESQVDRYTQQFARMEVLINQMNAQSSQLASLMGG